MKEESCGCAQRHHCVGSLKKNWTTQKSVLLLSSVPSTAPSIPVLVRDGGVGLSHTRLPNCQAKRRVNGGCQTCLFTLANPWWNQLFRWVDSEKKNYKQKKDVHLGTQYLGKCIPFYMDHTQNQSMIQFISMQPKLALPTPRHTLNTFTGPYPGRALELVEASMIWLTILRVVVKLDVYN